MAKKNEWLNSLRTWLVGGIARTGQRERAKHDAERGAAAGTADGRAGHPISGSAHSPDR